MMKGLLHSKRFKKNLSKWLFMYVGVMLLLTSVITYSRYISSWLQQDDARITKFEVKIDKLVCTNYEDDYHCSKNRPTALIPYYVNVNTKNLETKALLVLTFDVDSKFEIVRIDEVTKQDGKDPLYKEIYGELEDGSYDLKDTIHYTRSKISTKLELKQHFKPTGKETTYRVTVRYTPSRVYDKDGNFLYYDFENDVVFKDGNADLENIVRVDYSAKQEK